MFPSVLYRSRRTPRRPQARFQTEFLRRPANPGLRAQRAVSADRRANRLTLGLRHRRVHRLDPSRTSWCGPWVQQGLFTARAQTRPRPLLGTLRQRRTQRIPLDVSQHNPKVFILLDWECFEASLPDVARAVIMSEIAAGMSGEQPVHPAAQVAIVNRPESQMKVIGHDTVGEQPDRVTKPCFGDQGDKGLVVLRLVKDRGAAVAPVQDMIAVPPPRTSAPFAACRLSPQVRLRITVATFYPNYAKDVNNKLCPEWH
jgi:hypothetical protein